MTSLLGNSDKAMKSFCYHCIEYIKFYRGTKFHDHGNKNSDVMIGVGGTCLKVLKKPMAKRVKSKLLRLYNV